MLSIGKLGAGQERYYLDKVAEGAEDYYSGEGEAEGYWLGDAAAELGLEGKVDPDQLIAMLTGVNPATGEPLGLRHVAGRGPVPGFDLTFSAPKSVSLTWALGGEDAGAEVAAAHAKAVKAALDYLQREACWTRRGKGGREFLKGNGFLAAAYVHRSSRAGDPQLHTHVLIANATKGADGRWTRLYHPAIYNHAKTAGYIYEAHLRHELTLRLGVSWEQPRNGIAEIAGFDPDHLRAFSQRRQEIIEAAAPDASASSMRVATLATRKAKDRDLTEESLRDSWRQRAAEIGLDRELIGSTFAREQAERQVLTVEELAERLTAHASHFDRRDAIQAVADSLPSGAPAHEVEQIADAFLASSLIVPIGADVKGQRYTTEQILELEREALGSAAEMVFRIDRGVVPEIIVARTLDSRPAMKPDQEAMVRRLLGGGEGLVVVIGEAGTGKTYATTAAAEGWLAAGFKLRAAAPTWRAANVLRSEGLDATSVARLLGEFDRAALQGKPALRPNSVLVVDEAGMVGSADLARLIAHAESSGAKLVLIGDPAQLGEIEAGGLFAAIADRTDPVRLDEVIRQSHELDREGARRIRRGEGAEALSIYREEGRILVAADPAERREAMVADWWESYAAGEDALMVAKRNAEVEKLNALARETMRAEGRLGSAEIEVGEMRFAAGDQVITRVNDHRAEIYNRERWVVRAVDPEAQTVVLDGIDTRGRVCVDSVFLERVNARDGAPALQHGYAVTSYQAQGATVDRAFVMADPSMDRQEFYVAASRSRGETNFYATPEVRLEREEIAPSEPGQSKDLEHIARAAERDGAQVSAHEQALRFRFAQLPSPELHGRLDQLLSEIGAERRNEAQHFEFAERIERYEARAMKAMEGAERIGELPRRQRKAETERITERVAMNQRAVENLEAERSALTPIEHQARAEAAVIEHLLAERERAMLAAVRISPPAYITKELGQRPSDPVKRREWDGAVRRIEGYRERHGVVDKDNALGREPESGTARASWQAEQSRLVQSQRELGREQVHERALDRGIEIGL
jgi:conjugative relaxase-like TrwC/TraI family protein